VRGNGPLGRWVRWWGWGADLQLALQQRDLVPQLDRPLPQLLAGRLTEQLVRVRARRRSGVRGVRAALRLRFGFGFGFGLGLG
jgi:hypothetical protein